MNSEQNPWTHLALPTYCFLAVLSSSCSSEPLLNQNKNPVKYYGSGRYAIDYKWEKVYSVRGINHRDIQKIDIENYIVRNGYIPEYCGSRGIIITKFGELEGGWGWAEFECEKNAP